MNSIFFYPGGKNKKGIKNWILSFKPNLVEEYREPFVGGGGIFFEFGIIGNRWINDMDNNLISVYKALRDRPEEFVKSCIDISPYIYGDEEVGVRDGSNVKCNSRLKDIFEKFVVDDNMDMALRYYFINRMNWNGRVRFEEKTTMYPSVRTGWNIVNGNRLQEACHYMNGVKITNVSYEELLLSSGENCWIYCDPPYMVNTFIRPNRKLYTYSFNETDHTKFFDNVCRSKHKVCVSYDDHPKIHEILSGRNLNVYEYDWCYSGTNSVSLDGKKSVKKELLITNYKPF